MTKVDVDLAAVSSDALSEMGRTAANLLVLRRLKAMETLSDDELRAMSEEARAELAARQPAPPASPPEVLDGWRIDQAICSPHQVTVRNEDGSVVVAGLWQVIVRNEETGDAREWGNVFFGANEPHMLEWCVEQIHLGEQLAKHRADVEAFEARREELGLTIEPADSSGLIAESAQPEASNGD